MFLLVTLAAASVILSIACGGDDSGGSSSGSDAASSSKPTARPGASKNETWAAGLCVAVSRRSAPGSRESPDPERREEKHNIPVRIDEISHLI